MSDTHLLHVPISLTSIAEVADVHCTAPKSGAGSEEYSETARFIFPRRGVFEWHTEGTITLADSTTAVFVGSGRGYRIGHPASGGDDCTTLRLPPELLLEALHVPLHSLHAVVLSARAQSRVQLLLLQLRKQRDTLAGDELSIDLLHTVCTELGAMNVVPRSAKDVTEVRCLIASHPERDLVLSQIASAVNVSPYHLARRFRMVTGTSIHQYRTRLRLALALERIIEGWTDLSALALDLGFAHHSHFTSTFRKAYGIRPSELRRSCASKMRTTQRSQRSALAPSSAVS